MKINLSIIVVEIRGERVITRIHTHTHPPPMQYLQTVDVGKLDIFTVFQGIQFLPLDKYMYLKVHCFVNLVETTYRYTCMYM